MERISLNGKWQITASDTKEQFMGDVPGSLMCAILDAGLMDDPYYRDNDKIAREWMLKDYDYERELELTEDFLSAEKVLLKCYGLDTIADIYVNGQKIAHTDNMHRTYEFDVKKALVPGRNKVCIHFASALKFVREMAEKKPLPVNVEPATDGFGYLRKAHNMFGWDSEPEIPDMGIWRDIELLAWSEARMDTVYVRQEHSEGLAKVRVEIPVEYSCSNEKAEQCLSIRVSLEAPDGAVISVKEAVTSELTAVELEVKNPMLWWPNGYGDQPLYTLHIKLFQEDKELDCQEKVIGIRDMKVRKEPDEWGESFEVNVNGVPIFAKGADHIPLDKFLQRETKERLEQMFKDCVDANYNFLRIWGGAVFPSDTFFDLADKYGILIWEDFMFACTIYDYTPEFEESIAAETRDNIKRLRHHASLALWCGNNENEWLFDEWDHAKTIEDRRNYVRQFEIVLADVAKEYDPDRLYYPSSPSSEGLFKDPNGGYAGDIHNWDIWHNAIKPYEAYKDYPSRFTSEFGLQSFPNYRTLKEAVAEEDLQLSSYIMDYRQRNGNGYGNAQIMYYVLQDLPYPADFERAVYASQVMQAEGVKFGSEFNRRMRDRCAGSLYWQLGDCWQAPTWSSIDYAGRWKALHYRSREFYAPLLLSLDREAGNVDFHVVSDCTEAKSGKVEWRLCDAGSEILKSGSFDVEAAPLSSKCFFSINEEELLNGTDKREVYLDASLVIDEEEANRNMLLFVKSKHFKFRDEEILTRIEEKEDCFEVTLTASAFAMYVYLDFEELDCHFEENFFNLTKGEKTVVIRKKKGMEWPSAEEMEKQLRILTVDDIAKEKH